MILTIAEIYHNINMFLGTPGGEFAKRFAESILLVTMTYMSASEFIRNRSKTQLKLMTAGFAALTIERMVLILSYSFIIFGNNQIASFLPIVLTFSQLIEALGLVLLTASFTYPIYSNKREKLIGNLKLRLVFLSCLFIITQGVILFSKGITSYPKFLVTSYFYFVVFKIVILTTSLIILIKNRRVLGKYNSNVIQAFFVYLITPIISIINILFYTKSNSYLYVASHPFPFISILLLMRVTYLKLADKAKLKRDLAETKEMYQHEKELGKLKDEFMSIVSHELRTPLTSIKLYLSLLRDGKFGEINPKQSEIVEILNSENSRLNNLINDVLTLSRYEKKKEKLNLSDIDLYFLVKNTVHINLVEDRNITIENKIKNNTIVKIDVDKFKQVIINLFSNSLKFTRTNGKITFDAIIKDNNVIFSIEDTGKGIAQDQIPKLFNKFYQIDEHMTRENQGIGLGLSIVQEIVKLHKGTIEVISELNKGTKISIKIPKK